MEASRRFGGSYRLISKAEKAEYDTSVKEEGEDAGILLGLCFGPQDGASMFLRNVG
jgi:hypothetical protein